MLADFSRIIDMVYTGGALKDEQDVEALVAAGVRSVIDCRAEFDDGPLFAAGGMAYLWNPTEDDGKPKPDGWWGRSLAFAKVSKTAGWPVLCHCAAGVNRGPSTAYGILRAIYGMDAIHAEALIRQARPQVGLAYKLDFERYWEVYGIR